MVLVKTVKYYLSVKRACNVFFSEDSEVLCFSEASNVLCFSDEGMQCVVF